MIGLLCVVVVYLESRDNVLVDHVDHAHSLNLNLTKKILTTKQPKEEGRLKKEGMGEVRVRLGIWLDIE